MTESNPFQTPESDVAPDNANNQSDGTDKKPSCHTVPILNGATWIFDGIKNFFISPFTWALVTILYVAILGLLSMIPFVSIISYILAPIFLAGLMICARDNKYNQTFLIKNLFDGFSLNGGKLAGLGALYLGSFLILGIVVGVIGALVFLGAVDNFEDILNLNFFTQESEQLVLLILLVVLIAMALVIPITMAFWFAPILVIFHDIEIFESIKLSFMACLKNMLPYLTYSVLYLVLYFIAAIPIIILVVFFSDPEPNILTIMLMIIIGVIEIVAFMSVFFTSVFASYEDIFSIER